VEVLFDGSILISDDKTGYIYKLSYKGTVNDQINFFEDKTNYIMCNYSYFEPEPEPSMQPDFASTASPTSNPTLNPINNHTFSTTKPPSINQTTKLSGKFNEIHYYS